MTGFDRDKFKVETSDGRTFRLVEGFAFTRPSGEIIIVPAGTTSDGASTPRLLWHEIPPFGIYWPAAYLHDFLYRDTQRSKSECDDVLMEAMQILQTPKFEADAIYEGVNLFGWASFDGDRKTKSPSIVP